jgi:hypothetical protein
MGVKGIREKNVYFYYIILRLTGFATLTTGMMEYAEWLTGDSLLSTICRISASFIYHPGIPGISQYKWLSFQQKVG